MRNKNYYSERVISGLINDFPDIDWKLDPRDIMAVLDSIVNNQARAGYLENWKLGAPGFSEHFLTTWDNITVVDQNDGLPSYFEMPINYVDLPMQRGIDEIWPLRPQNDGKNHSVVIMSHRDIRLYASNMAGSLEGRLGGFTQNDRFIFNQCGVKKKYGNMGLRLAVRDSSLIGSDKPYPIPADKEEIIIQMAIAFFREKRATPANRVRDKIDQA